jgi:high-affinity Fe2+/Pb2+ permease
MDMKNENRNWSTISYIAAFLTGVILFWSLGKDWLNLESPLIFLAGLLGVAVAVFVFGAWNIHHNSHHKEN